MINISTFSIVAFDPVAAEWGVAVQSKFLAAASVVSWAQAGVGAIATQAYSNVSYGPNGLALLAKGQDAQQVLDDLVSQDDGRDRRQVGVVDSLGKSATFTGSACHEWAGGINGRYFSAQGNILVSEATVEAMASSFVKSTGELGDRLVEALAAGQNAGGDRRGRQSAGVLVVREKGGYGGFTDRYMDLRVDDDPYPIERLKGLVDLHHLFFKKPEPGEMVLIDGEIAREVQRILNWTNLYEGPITGELDPIAWNAFNTLIGNENFEERYNEQERLISKQVLAVLRSKYSN